jgi:hypothetical protein
VIIQCLSFGSIWHFHGSRNPDTGDIERSKSHYLNTSGWVRGSGKNKREIYRPRGDKGIDKGYVRINGFAAYFSDPSEILMHKFESPGVERCRNANRLLLARLAPRNANVDAFLVTVRSGSEGHIDIKSPWRTSGVRVIAWSEYKQENGDQEAILLIPVGGHIVTKFGRWEVTCQNSRQVLSLVA